MAIMSFNMASRCIEIHSMYLYESLASGEEVESSQVAPQSAAHSAHLGRFRSLHLWTRHDSSEVCRMSAAELLGHFRFSLCSGSSAGHMR